MEPAQIPSVDKHFPFFHSLFTLTALLTLLEPLAAWLPAQQIQCINYLYTIWLLNYGTALLKSLTFFILINLDANPNIMSCTVFVARLEGLEVMFLGAPRLGNCILWLLHIGCWLIRLDQIYPLGVCKTGRKEQKCQRWEQEAERGGAEPESSWECIKSQSKEYPSRLWGGGIRASVCTSTSFFPASGFPFSFSRWPW